MLHHWDDRLKLLSVTHRIVDGFPAEELSAAEVWAGRRSVTRNEYYQATQAGVRADIVFAVRAEDYGGQTLVECAGQQYDVVRSYQSEPDVISLTCARRGERT